MKLSEALAGAFLSLVIISGLSVTTVTAEAADNNISHQQNRIIRSSDLRLRQKLNDPVKQTSPAPAVKTQPVHQHVKKQQSTYKMAETKIAQKVTPANTAHHTMPQKAVQPAHSSSEVYIEKKAPVNNMEHVVIPSSK